MALYSISIFKSWKARAPEQRWVNTYEIESAALSPADLDETANDLATAEKIIHLNDVNFLSAIISTWEPDSNPYNPLAFRTIELAGVGSRDSTSQQPVDGNVCYVIRFLPTLGRAGRRFYRGCILESDVEAGATLRFTFSSGSPLNSGGALFTSFRTAMLALTASGAGPDNIVLAGNGGPSVERDIVDLAVGGISINKRNHRYFDVA